MEVTFSFFAKKNKFQERVNRRKTLDRIFSLLIIIFDRPVKKNSEDFLDSFVKFIIYLSHIFSSEISLCKVSS